jgi:hypothetical protein
MLVPDILGPKKVIQADAFGAEQFGRWSLSDIAVTGETMDIDLQGMTREELVSEVVKLRAGIRTHRDSTGHELCWHHPDLWGLLPEKTDPMPTVPEWPQFMRGCIRYRQSLDEQASGSPRTDEPFRA